MKKTPQTRRWINTCIVQKWDGEKYVDVELEGYWYSGPVSKAHEARNVDQQAFRFYDNTDTAVDAQDTDPTTLDVDTDYQFCVRISNTSNDSNANNEVFTLQYNHAGNGWVNVGVTDGGGIKVATATAGLTDGTTYGTDRLTGAVDTRLNGYEETSASRPSQTLGTNTYVELIYGFTIDSALVADADNIDFRICLDAAGTVLDNYAVAPSITVNEGAATQTIGYTQVAETNTANALTAAAIISVALGQVTETNVANALAPLQPQTIVYTQVAETDTANTIAVIGYSQDFEVSLSSNIATSGENTTDRLTGGGTHGGGRIQDDENPADSVNLTTGQSGEWAWSIKPTGATAGLAYDFRLVGTEGESFAYTVTPTWTIANNIAVGQVTETDLSQAFGVITSTIISLGQVAETDTSQTVSPATAFSLSYGQVVESDTANSLTPVAGVVSISYGQVTETDTSNTIAPVQGATVVGYTQVAESDAANAITPVAGTVSISYGQVVESDTANTITPVVGEVIISYTQAVESDTANGIAVIIGASSISYGQIAETDTANSLTPIAGAVSISYGQVVESDTSNTITVAQGVSSIAYGQVAETDTANSITPVAGVVSISYGQVVESDAANTIAALIGGQVAVGQVVETDVSNTITPVPSAVLIAYGQTLETDTASSLAAILYSTDFEVSLSSNIAASGENTTDRLTGGGTHGGGRIQDDENPADAVNLGANESGEWAWAIKPTGATNGLTYNFRLVLADGTELNYTVNPQWTISNAQVIGIGQVTETDVANAITGINNVTISYGQVAETDTAKTLTNLGDNSPYFEVSLSAFIPASGEATTDRLTGGGTHGGGRRQDDENPADSVDLATDESGEWEWAIRPTGITNGLAYDFRLVQADDTELDTYTVIPQWTIFTDVISFGQVVETDVANALSAPAALNQVVETDVANAIAVIPSVGQFHKILSQNYGSLPANSFIVAAGLSGVLAGDGYQMDLLTAPNSHPLSGDDLGIITISGAVTQVQTANYTIYDSSDSTVGTPGVLTINPTDVTGIGQVTETDTANAFLALALTLEQVVETDTANLLNKVAAVGQVTETDTANPIIAVNVVAIGQVVETDTAQSLGHVVSLGQCLETDTAKTISRSTNDITPIAQIAETDTANSLGPIFGQLASIAQVTEVDSARSFDTIVSAVSITLGQVIESDTAQALIVDIAKQSSGSLQSEPATLSGTAQVGRVASGALESKPAALYGVATVERLVPTEATPSFQRDVVNDLNLGNVPQIDEPQHYEAVLNVHNAIDTAQSKQDETNAELEARITALEP